MKRFRWPIILGVLIGGCVISEIVSNQRVNPAGRASTLNEYLAWRADADQFASMDVNGKRHVIALGPMSSFLLLSSGPSAYVFDESGRLVDWSDDVGDDHGFNKRWSAQKSFGTTPLSRSASAATQPSS